ncbi:hypothetical protein IQ07DRAFT_484597, partial [Pyrenochaeta sp. DS3sAY3a]
MSLSRLTIRVKKSFSGLFSSGDENAFLSQVKTTHSTTSGRENDTTNLDDTVSSVPYAGPPLSERGNQSPSDGSPSRRKKLITGLRSFKSLRSLRSSPGKMKNSDKNCDKSASPLESPCTPTRRITPSLMLTFEESPQTEPYFDMSKLDRSSPPDSVVSHSSPIMIP